MKVGEFSIEVWGPYPCWIELKDNRGNEIRFSHKELINLEHAVKWAKREAKQKLGTDASEVGD